MRRVFRDCPGSLAVCLWDGRTLAFDEGAPHFTLAFREPRPFRDLVLHRDPLCLAEAFFRDKVDVEGDLYAALGLKDHLASLRRRRGSMPPSCPARPSRTGRAGKPR